MRIIVANATRYTPHDGTVTVTLARVGGTIDLVVDDSGPGVPDTLLERLGERLFRVDPSRDRRTGGHGLGLAIARRIAARHDGEVAFERSPLGGLRVTVTLPHCA